MEQVAPGLSGRGTPCLLFWLRQFSIHWCCPKSGDKLCFLQTCSFHIIKKINEVIDNTIRSLYVMETELNKQHVCKGLRWLLLIKNDNLNETGKEKLLRSPKYESATNRSILSQKRN